MDSKADLHQTVAEVVEAVEDIDGVRVEDAHIDQMVDPETVNPIAAMLGGNVGEKKDMIHLIAEPSDEEPIDEKNEAEDPIEGVDVPVGDSEDN